MIKIDVRHLTPRPAFAFNSGQCVMNVHETHEGNGQLQRKCQNHMNGQFNDLERQNASSCFNQSVYAQSRWREMDEIDVKADQIDQHDSGANVRNEHFHAKPTVAASHDNERSAPHKKTH
jgi:hypothetical protein